MYQSYLYRNGTLKNITLILNACNKPLLKTQSLFVWPAVTDYSNNQLHTLI